MLRTEAEIILSMLARTLAADATPVWHRTLILEVFRVLVQHETLLQHIFTSYDVGNAASGVFAKLTASDAAADDYFGSSVAISGSVLVVGARGNDNAASSSGSAYVFS